MSDDIAELEPRTDVHVKPLLAIFGTVFTVATFVVPAGSIASRALLAGLGASISALLWRGIVAFRRHQLDPGFAILTAITIGFIAGYLAVLLSDPEATLTALEESDGSDEEDLDSESPAPDLLETEPLASDPSAPTGESAGPIAAFDPSNEEVYSSGTVTLDVDGFVGVDLRDFDSASGSYEIRPTSSLLGGEGGTQLGLFSRELPRSFDTCRDHTEWVTALTWEQVELGTFICLRYGDRRGLMRVDVMPEFESNDPWVQLTGVVWDRIVDG